MENKQVLSHKQLLRMLDHSFDEILIFDKKGNVVYVNSSCTSHYGQFAEDMIGKQSDDLVKQNLWGPRLSPLAQLYKKRLTMEQRSCTGNLLLTTATPIFDKNGEVEYIIENVRDITEGQGLQDEAEITKAFLGEIGETAIEQRFKDAPMQNFIAVSSVMQDILKQALRISMVDSNVLITGESGTGKGLMAEYIHKSSPRQKGPFVSINCAALPESLIESELFGYTKGAFSGAAAQGKRGLIHSAEKGTLFLDEIGEIPVSVQAKLLHFIQDGTYFEVGGTVEKTANCRIIAATNQDLQETVKKNEFREDLFYRLKVFEIAIPPLTDRHDDVMPLIQFYLQKFNEKYHLHQQISQECMHALCRYPWPGNIRELANILEQMVVMSQQGTITERDLPITIRHSNLPQVDFPIKDLDKQGGDETDSPAQRLAIIQNRANRERGELVKSLYKTEKSSRKIAAALNISQSTAHRYIKQYCKE